MISSYQISIQNNVLHTIFVYNRFREWNTLKRRNYQFGNVSFDMNSKRYVKINTKHQFQLEWNFRAFMLFLEFRSIYIELVCGSVTCSYTHTIIIVISHIFHVKTNVI